MRWHDPITMTVAFFLLVVLALMLLLIMRRLLWGRYLRRRINKIGEWGLMLDQIIARMDEPRPEELHELANESRFTLSVLEEILLARMDLMAGCSRLPLIKVFQQSALLNRCIVELEGRDVAKRRKAVDMLGRAASRDYADHLTGALNDTDGMVRMIAARGLGKMGIQIAAPAMVDQLALLEERQCLEIVDVLINLAAAALVPLSHALYDDSEQKRYFAALAVSHICDNGRCQRIIISKMPRRRSSDVPAEFPEELPHLLIDLTMDQSPRVRRAAVDALASLQVVRAAPRVEKLLASDPDPEVRRSAAAAMSLLARNESAGPVLHALNDPTWEVQCAAANTLISLGGPWLERLSWPRYRGTDTGRWLEEIEAEVGSWG